MKPSVPSIDFDQQPFIAIWELTQACDLACVHCRACAQPNRHPLELSTEEGKRLIDQIAEWKVPVFVMTGGDPIKRPDVYELVQYATSIGIRTSMTPSATPLLTPEVIGKLKESGLARLAVSLDGATAETHDSFRGMSGSFDRTMDVIRWANEAGLPVQINTTFSRRNIGDLDAIVELLKAKRISLWSVFFLVPTGRGKPDDLLSGDEFEQVFAKLYELSKESSFDIRTTEAQHYRRYVLQQRVQDRREGRELAPVLEGKPLDSIGRAPRGLNDGKGFVFISHLGDVFPSGFLPSAGGNIRTQPLAEIYQQSEAFRELRDTGKLKGKCGACEFKQICGGSRSRAYAITGDPLAEEPCCSYVPKGYVPPLKSEVEPVRELVVLG